MNKPDYKKITQALNYLASKEGGKISYMKALKLLYLADRLHLRRYGRLITDDRLVAMKNGTLGSQAKDIVVQNEHLPYSVYQYSEDKLDRSTPNVIGKKIEEKDQLSDTDIECVDEVYDLLGDKDQFALADLTHSLPEWKRHEYVIESKEKLVVDLEVEDLFKETDQPILNRLYSESLDELSLSRELFNESIEQKACLA